MTAEPEADTTAASDQSVPRVLEWIAAVRSWGSAPSRRRLVYLVALVLFVGSTVVAWQSLPETEEGLDWTLVALAALLVLPGALVNAEEYRVSADVLGQDVPLARALRVSVIAAAFNLLPVPGSVVVRTGALTKGGSTTRRAVASTAATGLVYIGAALILAGAVQVQQGEGELALVLVAAISGVGLFVAALLLIARLTGHVPHRQMVRLTAVEFLSVTIKAVRLLLVISALGYELDLAQAASLSVATVAASAIGVFPGGLGIRELLAGVISPAIGLPVSVGLVGTSFDRVIGLATLSVVGAAVLWVTRSEEVEEPET
jgi:uncharacterized membrane protein YbhN (UPF0104 family)